MVVVGTVVVVVVVVGTAAGPVTLPTMVMTSVLLATLGLITSWAVMVSTSPELMLWGTVRVTVLVAPPLRAVTVPEPAVFVVSTMLK